MGFYKFDPWGAGLGANSSEIMKTIFSVIYNFEGVSWVRNNNRKHIFSSYITAQITGSLAL